jgi:hypothetical protein
MAARHIKRLQQQLDATSKAAEEEQAVTTEEEESEEGQQVKPFNPFDLLDEEEVSVVVHALSTAASSAALQESQLVCTICIHF